MIVKQTIVYADVGCLSCFPFERTVFESTGDTSGPSIVTVALHVSLILGVVGGYECEEVVVSESILIAEPYPSCHGV